MVNHSDHELDRIFHALSDSTRRRMLSQLARGECSVTELAEPHELTFAGISKHLKVLEGARFVEKTKDGRKFRCRANLEPLDRVQEVLEELGRFWHSRLESLEKFLIENDAKTEKTHGTRAKTNRRSKGRR